MDLGSELVGCITVTKSVPLDDIEPPAKKKINPEVPDDLYQRWKPFGMGTSYMYLHDVHGDYYDTFFP